MIDSMRVNTYKVLSDKIDEGLRGFIWNDLPHPPQEEADAERLVDLAHNRVMNAISEYFFFEGDL